MPLYLCLDQGGHATRAIVFDGRGAALARAVRPVPTRRPAPDRVEQDPEAVVASLADAAREAVASLGPRAAELACAGLATQRSSVVCWDRETGVPLSPVISWQDRRAHAWLARLAPRAGEIGAITGLRLSAHYGASKLRWCLDRQAGARAALRRKRLAMGPLASFLAFRALDERPFVADPSNAQRTLLWNLGTRAWDDRLLDLFGVPRDALPSPVPTRHDFGRLRVDGRVLPMTIVTGDQSAALFAFGLPREEAVYVNLGTGAFAQRPVPAPRRAEGLLTGIVHAEGRSATYALEGTVNGAGAALAWAAETLGLPGIETELSGWLARAADPPLFLNGVGGLGAPYWAADFPTRFEGGGEPWLKAAAVAESIAFLLAVNCERMAAAAGPARTLLLTGGLAVQDGIVQRLADLAGVDAWRSREREATARGLAWLLAGRPSDWPAPEGELFRPAPNGPLRSRYGRWLEAMARALGRQPPGSG